MDNTGWALNNICVISLGYFKDGMFTDYFLTRIDVNWLSEAIE